MDAADYVETKLDLALGLSGYGRSGWCAQLCWKKYCEKETPRKKARAGEFLKKLS